MPIEVVRNILCIDQFSNLGGAQRCLLDVLPAFVERGWHVHLALPDEGPFSNAVRNLDLPVHILNCHSYTSGTKPLQELLKYAWETPHLAGALRHIAYQAKADLLYVNGPRLLPAAAWVARRCSIPLLFHCHHRLAQNSAIWLTGRSLRFARARLIASCRFVVEPLRSYVQPQRVSVVYNGVAALPKIPAKRGDKVRRIGVIGRIEPEKGQLEFIRASHLVAGEFPDCEFAVIGAPLFSDRRYFDQVVEASLGLPIEFSGWQEDIATVLSDLDLLVVPSPRFDATTRVILEAFAAGVPVVAFASGGIPEVLEDNVTGFLVTEVTANSLANRIGSVLKMAPDLRSAVIARAKAAWHQHYKLDRFQQEICNLIAGVRSFA